MRSLSITDIFSLSLPRSVSPFISLLGGCREGRVRIHSRKTQTGTLAEGNREGEVSAGSP